MNEIENKKHLKTNFMNDLESVTEYFGHTNIING